jgi:hypothetical protein
MSLSPAENSEFSRGDLERDSLEMLIPQNPPDRLENVHCRWLRLY